MVTRNEQYFDDVMAYTNAYLRKNFPRPETQQERAARLVAEAKQRHPEWEVKRLAVPLE